MFFGIVRLVDASLVDANLAGGAWGIALAAPA
jgi:hypothetical protein